MALPPSVLADPVWSHLAENWKPIPKRPGYMIGIAIMGVVILIVPLIYLAVIGLVGWGVWWHLTNDGGFISHVRGRLVLGALALYLAPAVAGVLLVILMLKPIFAPRARKGREVMLAEYEELKLHSFVQNVCAVVGAPPPKRINIDCDPNASAGFRGGALSIFRRGDLTLTIGLPLVAGMTKRQFAGILAHEFGHFSQGAGMRVSYTVSTMIGWMLRTALGRDAWDEWIEEFGEASGSLWGVLFALVCRVCIGIARLLLRLLAMFTIALCSFMLKQMEYDADRYEVQLTGSAEFGPTFQRLGELGAAAGRAHDECFIGFRRDRALPDNYPAFIGALSRRLTPEDRESLHKIIDRQGAGLFSTHPATKSRVAAAKKLDQPGLYTDSAPARELFGDFDAACKRATIGHFHGLMGSDFVGVKLTPTSDLTASSEKEAAREATLPRYLGFDPPTWRPCFPTLGRVPVVGDAKVLVQRLRAARHALKEQAGAARVQVAEYRKHADEGAKWDHARTVLDAGLTVDYRALGLQSATRLGVSAKVESCNGAAAEAAGVIDEAGETAMARLGASLALLGVKGIERMVPDAPKRHARADVLLAAMDMLRQTFPMAAAVRHAVSCSTVAAGAVRNQKTLDAAKKVVRPLSDEICNRMDNARRTAGGTLDPFAPGAPSHDEYAPQYNVTNMGESLVGATPVWRDLEEILGAGELFTGRWAETYRRVLGELVEIGEHVERALATCAKAPVDSVQTKSPARAG